MRSLTRNNVANARKMIRAHRGRSYMTMLGIVISIASVVTVASIGEGVKQQVTNQIHHVGDTIITIRQGSKQSSGGALKSLIAPRASGQLLDKDVGAVAHTQHISSSSPLALVPGRLVTEHGNYTAGSVVGVGNELPTLVNQAVAYGSFFTDDDAGQNVAVLGERAAQAMFNSEVPLGRTFTFRGKEFMVRGIFNEFPTVPLSADISYNDAVFIPYSTARVLTDGAAVPYQILAMASSPQVVTSAVRNLNASLLKSHGDTQDFSVLKSSETVAASGSVVNLLTELIVGAAAISLFVSGIGIMNITLVSVTERLHEIGIRKAVGATNRQILGEFMAEAVVLSVSGAILGIIASLIINLLLRIFTNIAPVVEWQVVVLATFCSVLIGVVFGSVPALKAARKDPIAALRGE